MKHVRCDLCGADDPEPLAHNGRMGLPVSTVICRRCGLVYTNPLRELDDYEGEAREKVARLMRAADRPSEKYLARSARRAAGAVEMLGDLLRPGARVLDVGCSAGALLAMAAERGCQVVGVEPEPAFAAYTREAHGFTVHECLLEDAPLQPATLDVVCASHVLEHTESPSAFLGRIAELLSPGGRVFVEVPNLLEPRCSFRRIFHVAHRYNFTPRTLAAVVRKAGFAAERERELAGPGTMQALGRRPAEGEPRAEPFDSAGADDYRVVTRRVRAHRWRYYTSGMFLTRKLKGRR